MDKQWIINQLETGNALPELPRSIARLFSLLATPHTRNNDDVIEEIGKIDFIQEMLWKNLSSVYFSCAAGKESLPELLELIGPQNINALLIAFVVKRLLPQRLGRAKEFDREKYWQHSLATAIGARSIAEKTKIADKETVFAYGLIHDIGVTVMDICLPELLDEICRIKRRGTPQIIAEKELLAGMSHEDVGSWFCGKWKLPLDIHAVVKYHHRPLSATFCVDETKMMYLADMMSAECCEQSIGVKLPTKTEETVRGHLGITTTGLAAIKQKLPAEMAAVNRLLSF